MTSVTKTELSDPRMATLKVDIDIPVDVNPEANAHVDVNKYERIKLTVDQYRFFQKHGWLKVPGVFTKDDLTELNTHLDDILTGKEQIPGCHIDPTQSVEQNQSTFSRIHMLHRRHPLHEKYLLHPRVLDIVTQLCSRDVLALQTMCFFKGPGQEGQGYHQDSFAISTLPNTLLGAWIALTPATKENGCLWLSDGSHVEPLYPNQRNVATHENKELLGVFPVEHFSDTDVDVNDLGNVAKQYTEVAGTADPGDAFFFGGTLLHRSHANMTKDAPRRAFTSHYCDARSYVPWNHGEPYDGPSANDRHILARGDTHLPYEQPRFGMPTVLDRRIFNK